MNAEDITIAFTAALNARDWARAASYLAEAFVVTGVAPHPLSKRDFLQSQQAWVAAAPDWAVVLSDLHEANGAIVMTVQITGTQMATLALPGLAAFAATGKQFTTSDVATATVRGEHVVTLHLEARSPSALEQLGLGLPPQ